MTPNTIKESRAYVEKEEKRRRHQRKRTEVPTPPGGLRHQAIFVARPRLRH